MVNVRCVKQREAESCALNRDHLGCFRSVFNSTRRKRKGGRKRAKATVAAAISQLTSPRSPPFEVLSSRVVRSSPLTPLHHSPISPALLTQVNLRRLRASIPH